MGIEECKFVELPVVPGPQGDLAFAEGEEHVPFPIARVFFVYDVPREAVRGGHAHVAQQEVLFCLHGRLEVAIDDGSRRRAITLEDPRQGLYLPPLIWYDLVASSPGTVYMAMTSTHFDEADYIRDYEEYVAKIGAKAAG
jgi:dTDP-4-dehydrorhamnose 3,5-epimerase-like enzyme